MIWIKHLVLKKHFNEKKKEQQVGIHEPKTTRVYSEKDSADRPIRIYISRKAGITEFFMQKEYVLAKMTLV